MALGKVTDWWLGSDGLLHTYGSGGTITPPPPPAGPQVSAKITSQKDYDVATSSTTTTAQGATIVSTLWQWGDGGQSYGTTSSHTYAGSGTYTITVTVTDSNGATGKTTLTTTIVAPANQAPTARFTSSQSGLSISVDGSTSSDPDGTISSFAWDFGDGGADSGATVTHTYARAGSYTVKLTVTDNSGAKNAASKTVTIAQANQAPVLTQKVTTSGATSTAVLTATDADNDPLSYNTTWGDGASDAGQNVSHTYTAVGPWTVTSTVSDGKGGSDTKTQQVNPTISGGGTTSGNGDSGVNQTGVAGQQQTGSDVTSYPSTGSGDFSTKVNSVGSSKICSLPAGTFTFDDFAYDIGGGAVPNKFYEGAHLTNRGLYGAGSKSTTIQMNPNSSKKSGDVPTQSGTSNQLQYLWIYQTANAVIDGVKIVGTEQGHLYNGLRFQNNANAKLTNSTITHIPGNNSSPPGETFGVNFQNTSGTLTVENVTGDGGGVSAAMLGSNSVSAKCTIRNLYTFNHPYSAGWASWQQRGQMDFYNFQCYGARAFNAERIAAVVNFYDPIWSDPGSQDINPTYESGYTGGSVNLYFTDNAAWQRFLAARTKYKYVVCRTNSSSVSLGVTKDTVKVFVGGVRQSGTDYIRWVGGF